MKNVAVFDKPNWKTRGLYIVLAIGAGIALPALYRADRASPNPRQPAALHHDEGFFAWGANKSPLEAPSAGVTQGLRALASGTDDTSRTGPLIDRILVLNKARTEDPLDVLLKQLEKDPASRQEMLARLAKETDPQARSLIQFALARTGAADVAGFAIKMSGATGPEQRVKAYEMLAVMQDQSPQAKARIVEALSQEKDPQVLAQVLRTISPGEVRNPQEVAAMAEVLKEHRDSSDPQVRGAAMLASARWLGQQAEPEVARCTYSAVAQEVEYCMRAVVEGRLKGEPVKAALFDLAARDTAPVQLRQGAAAILGNFALNQQEYDKLIQLRAEQGR